MKYDTKEHYYKSDVTGLETHKFSIDAEDTILMQRLSSDTYSDPIRAVIRELCTNAYDAHQEAGQTKPFFIKLPTDGDLMFSVKDWGTGMPKQIFSETYTTYGKSLRRHTDDAIGSIGIGSKSPFAYTNNFTIINIHKGIKICAICSKDAAGIPSLKILSEEPTTEDNSVEIKFAVKRSDVAIFKQRATLVLQWFNNYESNETFDFSTLDTQNPVCTHDDFYYTNSSSMGLLMGNILYNVQYNLGEINKFPGLIFRAPIGAVNIAMSREELQYTRKTKDYLFKSLKKIRAIYDQLVQDAVDKSSNLLEALATYNKMNRKLLNDIPSFKGTRLEFSYDFLHEKVERYRANYTHYTIYGQHVASSAFFLSDIKQGRIKAAKKYLNDNKNISYVNLIDADNYQKFLDMFHLQSLPNISDHYVKANRTGRKTGVFKNDVLIFDSTRQGLPTNSHSVYWQICNNVADPNPVWAPIKNYKLVRGTALQDLNKILKFCGLKRPIYGIKNKEIKNWKTNKRAVHLDKFLRQELKKNHRIIEHFKNRYMSSHFDYRILDFIRSFVDISQYLTVDEINVLTTKYSDMPYGYDYIVKQFLTEKDITNMTAKLAAAYNKANQITGPKINIIKKYRIIDPTEQRTVLK